jgi:TonB-linked SusC/RagA family outer membrane protein
MKKFIYLLIFFFQLTTSNSSAQQLFQGKVTSEENGTVLKGATLTIASAKITVQSDENGQFSIKLNDGNYQLQVSYLGYLTKNISLTIPNQGSLVIPLKLVANQLNEVVINTGYQILKREQTVGSITTLSAAKLDEQKGTDLLGRLENITSGLIADRSTASGAGKLMIRGLSTIQGPKEVLVIVDNFPYEGDFANLNPNDVESISVLKDGVAASIWGARAGNGVVVVTTKKGAYQQKLQVDLTINNGIKEKTDLSQIRQISSSDFIDTELLLYGKGFYNSQINSTSKPALSPVVEILIKQTAGTLSASQATAAINALRNYDIRDDFDKYLYQLGHHQQYALQLKGGTTNYNWIFSAGYDQNTSELDDESSRLSAKFFNTIKPLKNLELGIGITITQNKSKVGKPGYGAITSKSGAIYPYAQLADENGNHLSIPKDYRQSYIETAGGGKLLNWLYYPLDDYQLIDNTDESQELRFNGNLNYKFLPGFSFDLKYQYQRQVDNGKVNNSVESYSVRSTINRFSSINATTGVVTNKVPYGGILDLNTDNMIANNARAQLSFDQSYGDHQLSAIAGSELREVRNTGNASRFYGYNDNILTTAAVDLTTPFPTFISGSTALIDNNNKLSASNNRFVSVYGNFAYTFKEKYTLFASGRRDASNLFGVNTNNKWNLLWSTGIAWNVSKEKWFKNETLPYLKLRLGYGISGNIDPNMTAQTTIEYFSDVSIYTQTPYSRFNNYANTELSWEKVGMLNIGLDFSTKANRISGTIEYFNKRTKDLFGVYPLDYTTGIGATITKNVASTAGNGVDLSINTINTKGALRWLTDLNLSYFKDKVLDYYLTSQQGSNYIQGSGSVSAIIGKPVYAMLSYPWAGLDPQTGDPLGYLNGVPSKDYAALMGSTVTINDLVYSGAVLPVYFGSMGQTLQYKNWQLTARAIFKAGHYIKKKSISYTGLYNSWSGNSDIANRWRQPGDEAFTNVPSQVYPAVSSRDNFYSGSETLVLKGDHVRLQYINLDYRVNAKVLERIFIKKLNLYANINNLGIIWKATKENIDPEYREGILPNKTIVFGIKAGF